MALPLHLHRHLLPLLPLFLLLSISTFPTTAVVLAATTAPVTKYHLYASHYNGHIYSLSLESNNNATYSLSLSSSLKTCGLMPSWLTFDAATRTLYCSDESWEGGIGSLTALAVDVDHQGDGSGGSGNLTELAKTNTPVGGVSNVVYSSADGRKFIAVAHYQGSALSTFELPLRPDAPALQTFTYTLPKPGADPSRQDAPHPHQVLLDPTGSFLLSPDLGADLVRVYAVNATSGRLNECPGIAFAAGSGPRHGVFWNPDSAANLAVVADPGHGHGHGHDRDRTRRRRGGGGGGGGGMGKRSVEDTMLFVASELGNTVTAFSVSYSKNATCLSFNQTQSLTPYPPDHNNGKGIPPGASLAEILARDHSLYVSVRNDHAFQPANNDSLATLSLSDSPDETQQTTVTFQRLTSSHGKVPRTFAINKAGDLVAVGNQASSTVVIIKRDPKTGELLGDDGVVASLDVGEPGTPGTAQGLSSIVWGE